VPLELLDAVRDADFVPEELRSALPVRLVVLVRLAVPLPVELLEEEVVRVEVPVAEELNVRRAEADTDAVRVVVREEVLVRVPAPLTLGEPLPFELLEADAVAEGDLLRSADLEWVGLVVVVRLGLVLTEAERVLVTLRVDVELAVPVRLLVAVRVLVAEAVPLREEVDDFVEVLETVDVRDPLEVLVDVGVSREVSEGRALRVAVRVLEELRVGRAAACQRARGCSNGILYRAGCAMTCSDICKGPGCSKGIRFFSARGGGSPTTIALKPKRRSSHLMAMILPRG
jgi:hypothetical protein